MLFADANVIQVDVAGLATAAAAFGTALATGFTLATKLLISYLRERDIRQLELSKELIEKNDAAIERMENMDNGWRVRDSENSKTLLEVVTKTVIATEHMASSNIALSGNLQQLGIDLREEWRKKGAKPQ